MKARLSLGRYPCHINHLNQARGQQILGEAQRILLRLSLIILSTVRSPIWIPWKTMEHTLFWATNSSSLRTKECPSTRSVVSNSQPPCDSSNKNSTAVKSTRRNILSLNSDECLGKKKTFRTSLLLSVNQGVLSKRSIPAPKLLGKRPAARYTNA